MRRLVMLLVVFPFAFAAICNAVTQTRIVITPKVDERVELLSIVFRLAGNFEYNMSPLKQYSADIDKYFAPYKSHPAIAMAKSLAEKNGVGFDAVMSMAVHLSSPPELRPLVAFSDEVPERRFGKENALQFAKLLRDFYRDTNFQRFFTLHRSFYDVSESRFNKVLVDLDLGWYKQFYGEMPKGQFHLLLGMNNGGGNYGPRVELPDDRDEIFAIVGGGTPDEAGDPVFDPSYLSIIIHEFNHSFVNPVAEKRKAELSQADHVFQQVAAKLQSQAYKSVQTMIDESLVRAAVILYFEAKGESSDQIGRRIIHEQALGFVWMDELCDLLRQYRSQRTKYPTFDAFIGNIVDFYRALNNRIEGKLADFSKKCVHVTDILPFSNHTLNVDPSTEEMVIRFDKGLDPGRYSINYGPQGADHSPILAKPEFSPDRKSIKLHLFLKPNQNYAFVLTPYAFASMDGYPLEEYAVDFKTR